MRIMRASWMQIFNISAQMTMCLPGILDSTYLAKKGVSDELNSDYVYQIE